MSRGRDEFPLSVGRDEFALGVLGTEVLVVVSDVLTGRDVMIICGVVDVTEVLGTEVLVVVIDVLTGHDVMVICGVVDVTEVLGTEALGVVIDERSDVRSESNGTRCRGVIDVEETMGVVSDAMPGTGADVL